LVKPHFIRCGFRQKGCDLSVTLTDKGHTKVTSFLSKAASYKMRFDQKIHLRTGQRKDDKLDQEALKFFHVSKVGINRKFTEANSSFALQTFLLRQKERIGVTVFLALYKKSKLEQLIPSLFTRRANRVCHPPPAINQPRALHSSGSD